MHGTHNGKMPKEKLGGPPHFHPPEASTFTFSEEYITSRPSALLLWGYREFTIRVTAGDADYDDGPFDD